jgi:hypothetical protein
MLCEPARSLKSRRGATGRAVVLREEPVWMTWMVFHEFTYGLHLLLLLFYILFCNHYLCLYNASRNTPMKDFLEHTLQTSLTSTRITTSQTAQLKRKQLTHCFKTEHEPSQGQSIESNRVRIGNSNKSVISCITSFSCTYVIDNLDLAHTPSASRNPSPTLRDLSRLHVNPNCDRNTHDRIH